MRGRGRREDLKKSSTTPDWIQFFCNFHFQHSQSFQITNNKYPQFVMLKNQTDFLVNNATSSQINSSLSLIVKYSSFRRIWDNEQVLCHLKMFTIRLLVRRLCCNSYRLLWALGTFYRLLTLIVQLRKIARLSFATKCIFIENLYMNWSISITIDQVVKFTEQYLIVTYYWLLLSYVLYFNSIYIFYI